MTEKKSDLTRNSCQSIGGDDDVEFALEEGMMMKLPVKESAGCLA